MSPRKPGRPPAVPVESVVESVRRLLADHAGKPCPSSESMAATLAVNEHTVRAAVRLLEAAGELRIERTAWIGGLRRRMRVRVGGEWCQWTKLSQRLKPALKITAPDLLAPGDAHHVARVLAVGRY